MGHFSVKITGLPGSLLSGNQHREAMEFARAHADGALLVHCYHGVGRSAAIALAILADRYGAGAEPDALEDLLAVRPEVTPNLVVVTLADQILGRSGKLIGAVAVWEANAPGLERARAARLKLAQDRPDLYARI